MNIEKKVTFYHPKQSAELDLIAFDSKDPYHAFIDLEFQSPSKEQKHYSILSIGVVIVDSEFQELETFYSLVRPLMPVNSFVLDLTKLTREELETAPLWDQVLIALKDLLQRYPKIKTYHFGPDDRKAIHSLCSWTETENPFPTLIDFKAKLEQLKLNKTKVFEQAPSLKYLADTFLFDTAAVASLKEHHALDDAKLLSYVAEAFKAPLTSPQIIAEFKRQLEQNLNQIQSFEAKEDRWDLKLSKGLEISVYYDESLGYWMKKSVFQLLRPGQQHLLVRLFCLEYKQSYDSTFL